MNSTKMMKTMNEIFRICKDVHSSGQREYADDENKVFANFDRIAKRLDLSQEEIVLVYLMKHIDGITSHVKGNKSQREDVRGRITDCIVYLCILWGMVEESEDSEEYMHTTTPLVNFEEETKDE